MVTKVCKFGGTSLATREQVDKAIDIMLSDESRRVMVVSASGARYDGDRKITDLLIDLGKGDSSAEDKINSRICEIIPDISYMANYLADDLNSRVNGKLRGNRAEILKAFGEFALAKIINAILKKRNIESKLLDPAELNFIIDINNGNPRPDSSCYKTIAKALNYGMKSLRVAVVPGFYGYTKSGLLATLPRNGTDISGAVMARAIRELDCVSKVIYENFSDEDGLKRANPKIVRCAEVIPEMTYLEARELAYMGFKLQDACFESIINQGIILNARNTNNSKHPGTRIVDSRKVNPIERIIGVACENDSIIIGMRKMYSDQEVGLGRKAFQVLEEMKLPYEHHPTGVDTLSLVIRGRYLDAKQDIDGIAKKIAGRCNAEITGIRSFSLLSVAGLGIQNHLDTHRRVFAALESAGARIRMADDGAEDLSFFVGVDRDKADDSVRAIYNEFFG